MVGIRESIRFLDGGVRNINDLQIISRKRLKEGTTNFLGKTFQYTDNLGFLYSKKEIFYEEVYKFKSKHDVPVIVDLGANMGLSVIYFKKLYPNAKVFAFEPDTNIFKMLKFNVKSQNLSDVELINAAAWIYDGELSFYPEGSLAGSVVVDFLQKGVRYKVKSIDIDAYLGSLLDKYKKIDFLKIDIEGAENTIIEAIADRMPLIENLFFEYHSVPGEDQKLQRFLVSDAKHDKQMNVSCYRKH